MSDLGDTSGPGSRAPHEAAVASSPKASIPIAVSDVDGPETSPIAFTWFRDRLAKKLYERMRAWATTQGRYSGQTWERAPTAAQGEAKFAVGMVLADITAMGFTIVSTDYAQAIEARRAETGTGSVNESAVSEGDAP